MLERENHLQNPEVDTEIVLRGGPGSPGGDSELERDYLLLAQWLLDVHRELSAKKRSVVDGEIDSSCPGRTI